MLQILNFKDPIHCFKDCLHPGFMPLYFVGISEIKHGDAFLKMRLHHEGCRITKTTPNSIYQKSVEFQRTTREVLTAVTNSMSNISILEVFLLFRGRLRLFSHPGRHIISGNFNADCVSPCGETGLKIDNISLDR